MSLARVACRAQVGLHAPLVHVEVSLACGLPNFFIVGLPATVVKESKERVRAALLHCAFEFPAGRITVSLAPADLPKEGGRFDLPIALGILLASGQIRMPAREDSTDAAAAGGRIISATAGSIVTAPPLSESAIRVSVQAAKRAVAESATRVRHSVRASLTRIAVVSLTQDNHPVSQFRFVGVVGCQ